ncbi:MAG: leucine-rich repeat domain-containing protein [Clostridia bacterium]|nr:leucine-rich repeat domain-containing protein [Clostridia bacterium]
MKKTTKILAAVAVSIVIIATIATVSLYKDNSSVLPAETTGIPSTTAYIPPTETESWFDWNAFASTLDLSTEPDSSLLDPSASTTVVPSTNNVVISVVYPSDYQFPTAPQISVPPVVSQSQQPVSSTAAPTKPAETTVKEVTPELHPYEYTIYDGEITLDKYIGDSKTPLIPAEIDGKPVTVIGRDCFNGTKGKNIESVIITSNVTKVGVAAFKNCSNLERVVFTDDTSVEIGASAFANCTSLNRVCLSSQTVSIGANAFENCSSLGDLAIPATVKEIGPNAFLGCSKIKIRCKQDSEAHATALRYEIPYVLE